MWSELAPYRDAPCSGSHPIRQLSDKNLTFHSLPGRRTLTSGPAYSASWTVRVLIVNYGLDPDDA